MAKHIAEIDSVTDGAKLYGYSVFTITFIL